MIKPSKIRLNYTPGLFGNGSTGRSLIALSKAIIQLQDKVNELVEENNRQSKIINHLSNEP